MDAEICRPSEFWQLRPIEFDWLLKARERQAKRQEAQLGQSTAQPADLKRLAT